MRKIKALLTDQKPFRCQFFSSKIITSMCPESKFQDAFLQKQGDSTNIYGKRARIPETIKKKKKWEDSDFLISKQNHEVTLMKKVQFWPKERHME